MHDGLLQANADRSRDCGARHSGRASGGRVPELLRRQHGLLTVRIRTSPKCMNRVKEAEARKDLSLHTSRTSISWCWRLRKRTRNSRIYSSAMIRTSISYGPRIRSLSTVFYGSIFWPRQALIAAAAIKRAKSIYCSLESWIYPLSRRTSSYVFANSR